MFAMRNESAAAAASSNVAAAAVTAACMETLEAELTSARDRVCAVEEELVQVQAAQEAKELAWVAEQEHADAERGRTEAELRQTVRTLQSMGLHTAIRHRESGSMRMAFTAWIGRGRRLLFLGWNGIWWRT